MLRAVSVCFSPSCQYFKIFTFVTCKASDTFVQTQIDDDISSWVLLWIHDVNLLIISNNLTKSTVHTRMKLKQPFC